MLAIRMQRTGRKGHAQFRVIVQDSHFHPTRGRIVAYLGSYDPHTKTTQIDKELAARYIGNGAQPSERVARLLKSEGVNLPTWVRASEPKARTIRNPEKLRRNRPAEEAPVEAPVAEEPATKEPAVEQPATETPAEEAPSKPATEDEVIETPAPAEETPAEEPAPEEPVAEPEAAAKEEPEAPAEG